jgi:hypothetical protein
MNDKILKSLKTTFDPNNPKTLWLTVSYLKKLGIKTEFPYSACPDRIYAEAAKLLGKPHEEFEEKAIARESQLRQWQKESEVIREQWNKERLERQKILSEALGCSIEEIEAKIEELKKIR